MKGTVVILCIFTALYAVQSEYSATDHDQHKGTRYDVPRDCTVEPVMYSRDTICFWNFENGLQGWTHTNGQTFPEAWGVMPSWLHPSDVLPFSGDSSMWIDDGGASSTLDSALSQVVVPTTDLRWLVYGYCNNGGSGSAVNDLYVGMKYFLDSMWHMLELRHYPSGTISGPTWDSIDVTDFGRADSLQVYFFYTDNNTVGNWACFDNVGLYTADTGFQPLHDVGCIEVVSPPAGFQAASWYQVVGQVHNFGNTPESFNVRATVYDTMNWNVIFDEMIVLVDFPPDADTNIIFGAVDFTSYSHFYTEIYTLLLDDYNPADDTSGIYTRTSLILGDVVFEMDIEAICGDNQLLGIEFDGQRFYITGGNNGIDPNKIYVVDTSGTLLWTLDQPAHSTGWGWRDLAWDGVYSGPDRIDTLYGSVDPNVDYFSIDLTGGNLIYHWSSPGAQSPNRALAYYPDSSWFYTANFSSDCYKFRKNGIIIQNVYNTYAMYGAAYDPYWLGPSVWWHSQDDPGTGFDCQISRMDPFTMNFVGAPFGFTLPSTLSDGMAGGLCFWMGSAWPYDVLFALVQGTPHDYIVGLYVRDWWDYKKIEAGAEEASAISIAIDMMNLTKGHIPITYTTTMQCHVSLRVYDSMGRVVRTIVEGSEAAGKKTVKWDSRDKHRCRLSNGVYFLQLQAGDYSTTEKLLLIR